MKIIFTICAVLLMTESVWAQSSEKMSYQAAQTGKVTGIVKTDGYPIEYAQVIIDSTSFGLIFGSPSWINPSTI